MHDHQPTILTTDDHLRLQTLMSTLIGARTPFAALLRRKLGSAVVIPPADAGSDLVTSGRQLRFKIAGVRPEERTLVWNPNDRPDDLTLSLLLPRGLALLGLSTGQSIAFEADDRSTQTVLVEHVFADDEDADELPEVAARGRDPFGRSGVPPFRASARLRPPAFSALGDDPGPGVA